MIELVLSTEVSTVRVIAVRQLQHMTSPRETGCCAFVVADTTRRFNSDSATKQRSNSATVQQAKRAFSTVAIFKFFSTAASNVNSYLY